MPQTKAKNKDKDKSSDVIDDNDTKRHSDVKDNTDNHATPSKAAVIPKKPGRLNGEVALTLHTAYAQKLFLGFQPDKRSINLLQFGGRMSEIWDAAERDDPYADWYLLKVYDQLIQLQKQLSAEIGKYQATLNKASHLTQLTIAPFESQRPSIQLLWFRTQYGYIAAGLVALFDQLMRIVLTADRVGIRLEPSQKIIRQTWLDQLLALFRLPFKWKPFEISRADMKAQSESAKAAQATMGKLPAFILSGKLRSPFAPAIKTNLAVEKEPASPPNNST